MRPLRIFYFDYLCVARLQPTTTRMRIIYVFYLPSWSALFVWTRFFIRDGVFCPHHASKNGVVCPQPCGDQAERQLHKPNGVFCPRSCPQAGRRGFSANRAFHAKCRVSSAVLCAGVAKVVAQKCLSRPNRVVFPPFCPHAGRGDPDQIFNLAIFTSPLFCDKHQ